LPYLKGKSIGIVSNQTSIIGNKKKHLVDSLHKLGIKIVSVFVLNMALDAMQVQVQRCRMKAAFSLQLSLVLLIELGQV